jgi:drug efflux transport system ATP-binding protein
MAEAAVIARGLTRSFGKTVAVAGVDLEVETGEIMGLIGPDGAGKTTTMRMLVGAIAIDSGSAAIAGIDVATNPEGVKRLIGYMPQRFSLYGDLTVIENMKFFADLYGVTGKAYRKREEELLQFSRLGPHSKKLAASLSGGMQKKLALSCNLLHKPQVLLLDEPTNGVDPVSRRELWGLLYDLLGSGTTIVVSTPYMDEAERCTRVAMLYDGKVLVCDRPSELNEKLDGEVVAIASDRGKDAVALLADLPGVLNIYPFHGLVHILFADGKHGMAAVTDRAKNSRMRIDNMEIVPPSFEDVFIRWIEKGETDARH